MVRHKSFGSMQCPIARSLDETGDWWSMLILRSAFMGVRRFQDFEERLGIAPTTLARRLETLAEHELLARRTYSERPHREEYELTPKGLDFLPVLLTLAAWGNRWLAPEGVAIECVDPKTGRHVEPIVVDRETGRELKPGTVALRAGPGARPAVKQGLAKWVLLGAATAVSAALLGCGSSSPGGPGPAEAETPAAKTIASFHTALAEADYGAVDGIIGELDAQREAEPNDAAVVLFSALARMWKVGEAKRDPSLGPLAERAPIAVESLELFEQARDLNPNDDRIPAWVGFMKVRIGEAVGDAATIADGIAGLDASVAKFPTFTHFVRGLGLLGRPPGDPEFTKAPEDMWAVIASCGYAVDRSNPDYAYPEAAALAGAGICRDTPLVKHNWGGFFLHAGDVFSKAGDAKTASAFWENAKKSPTYSSWAFKGDLEDRIANADSRAALLSDGDPANDPELFADSAHVCVGCHAE
jgi:DNA-binding HxlR family transcriptional regulator